jgi:choline dehydrogenase-like flavoprotein
MGRAGARLAPGPASGYSGIEMSVSFTGGRPSPKKDGAPALGAAASSPLDPLPFRRAAIALAEAVIPGSPSIPAADEATVALADEVVSHFQPALATAWRVAQATLDAAAVAQKGRPFHRLSASAQHELVRRWEEDPVLRTPLGLVSLVYRFVHFDRKPVYESLGGKLNVVNHLEEPRWLKQIHRADEWPGTEDVECDVVVIGTGAGGAVVGRELAERGLAVVFVEEGEHHRRDSFDGSSVRAHQRFYRGAFSVGNAMMPILMGRMVGGSTAINGGTCFRTPPWILDRWCEEIGTDEFAPSTMLRHFERVESVLQVAPSERRFIGPIADVMSRGCDALGWSHAPIRRNAPGCDGSGFCDFGCRTDAKRGTNLSYLPPALERGSLVFSELRAERILLDGKRAVGVSGVTRSGRTMRVRGRAVVLAGGSIPTPLLLLDQGIANGSGEVGRNLTIQPSSGFSALFDEEIRGRKHIPQGYACDEFLRQGILMMAAQPDVNVAGVLFPFSGQRLMEALARIDNVASFALLVRDSSRNGRVWRDVAGFPAITYSMTREDVEHMHTAMIHAGEMCLAAGARTLYPVTLKNQVIQGARDFQAFKKASLAASDFVWTSYHPMGTCKMGHDPRSSVVDLDHQAHDVPGLFIVDGSTVPSALGVNPQLTIMAMATRAAEKIAALL